ncbi:hypothetical protein [Streptomyces sp. NPDC058735]|uniref:hypothetical protein n=1 Tax=unclassified Streptomyces TaxID=2593676 RepID=UPI003690B922
MQDAIRHHLHSPRDGGLRDGGGDVPDADEVLATLTEEWPATRWLSRSDDHALLRETGKALARAVSDSHEPDVPWAGLRGPAAAHGILRSLIRRRLADLDRVAGAAMQAVAGRMNHSLRHHFGPGATRFLGDVLVYQRHREQIHARVRERIEDVDPELGRRPDRPVRLVAVDMATAREPLWTSSLLTFGSQAAYFHLCDPRGGRLAPHTGHEPVDLPDSLARWTNLWQPLDVLAFPVSRVFRLADGTSPRRPAAAAHRQRGTVDPLRLLGPAGTGFRDQRCDAAADVGVVSPAHRRKRAAVPEYRRTSLRGSAVYSW